MIINQEKLYNNLGRELVHCELNCVGINNNKKTGYFPRLLFLEERDKISKGVIVVGLNPGKCDKKEREALSQNQNYWFSQRDYYSKNLERWAYFRRIKELFNLLNYKGDILWTNLVKCECLGENGDLPVQTIRICVNKFLKQEINDLLPNCDIFAMGNRSFDICSAAFPNNFVVGLPHPSGHYSSKKFIELLKKIKQKRKEYNNLITKKRDKNGHLLAVKL